MKVGVTGSSGLVGSALVRELKTQGHEVIALVRRAATGPGEVSWNESEGLSPSPALAGMDALVHLAGENIAAGRWTAAQKERIRASRVAGTTALATAAARLVPRPATFVCASAIGYYGERGNQVCDEQAPPGPRFLAEVCQQWEAATQPAAAAGMRVVNLRLGVVLSSRGGALAKMLTPFRLGLGGRVGGGEQYWSWISLADLVGSILHCLTTHSLVGAVNAVAPAAVTNAEFTRTLGKVLRRPTFFPLPAFAARLVLGEMADELLLASTRVVPKRLLETGYAFQHANLEAALRHELATSGPTTTG